MRLKNALIPFSISLFNLSAEEGKNNHDERPTHRVKVDGFWMDATPVTNRQFKEFVDATGYVTTAEKAPSLEEIMSQVKILPDRRLVMILKNLLPKNMCIEAIHF